jgi:hypothetical protein
MDMVQGERRGKRYSEGVVDTVAEGGWPDAMVEVGPELVERDHLGLGPNRGLAIPRGVVPARGRCGVSGVAWAVWCERCGVGGVAWAV